MVELCSEFRGFRVFVPGVGFQSCALTLCWRCFRWCSMS